MLEEILSLNLFGFFLIFARLGTAMALMPGFSSGFVPSRIRFSIALALSFVLAPVLIPTLPVRPSTVAGMGILITGEVLIGAFFGMFARIMVSALQTAGTIISYVSSMANALIQDPIAEQQSSTIAGFLLITGVVLVFVGLTYYIGLGLLGRLMPTLQVFFFGLPFQIGVQIWVLAISVSGILVVFLRNFEEGYRDFILP